MSAMGAVCWGLHKVKRPAFQFYPADWRKDVELQSCSMAAQGLWINALCIAHECDPYGHLTINGKGMNSAQLSRQVGLSVKETDSLLTELVDAGVAKRTDESVIYSSRMVKDESLRNVRAEAGRLGGNPSLLKQRDNQQDNPGSKQTKKQKPTPSSSSSSASSSSNEIPPPDGVSPSVWTDFLKLRKAKKAPMTDTALDGIRKESVKAGLSLERALALCCKRGWQGFEAAWVKDQDHEKSSVWHESAAGIISKAEELGLDPQDEVMEPFPMFKARVMSAAQGAIA